MKNLDLESLKKVSHKIVNDAVDKAREEKSKELQHGYYMTNAKVADVVSNPDVFIKELEEKNAKLIAERMQKKIKGSEVIVKNSERKAIAVLESREVFGKRFNIYGNFENPLFLAKNVGDMIDHSNIAKMLKTIDADEKLICMAYVVESKLSTVVDNELIEPIVTSAQPSTEVNGNEMPATHGQTRNMWFLTEYGLYEVLMQSRKPIAKEFKSRVKEILKEIRKHGYYMTDAKTTEIINDPTPFIKELEDKNARLIADLEAERAEKKQLSFEREYLQLAVEKSRPKVTFANTVAEASCGSVLTGDLAKMITQAGYGPIGAIRINIWLKENGWLIKSLRRSDRGRPTQMAMERGYFELVVSVVKGKVVWTPYVTVKGQQHFLEKFRKMHFDRLEA
jgi:anti-repressor protein